MESVHLQDYSVLFLLLGLLSFLSLIRFIFPHYFKSLLIPKYFFGFSAGQGALGVAILPVFVFCISTFYYFYVKENLYEFTSSVGLEFSRVYGVVAGVLLISILLSFFILRFVGKDELTYKLINIDIFSSLWGVIAFLLFITLYHFSLLQKEILINSWLAILAFLFVFVLYYTSFFMVKFRINMLTIISYLCTSKILPVLLIYLLWVYVG